MVRYALSLAFVAFAMMCAVQAAELDFALVVQRHGQRSPIVHFSEDHTFETAWPFGPGQLTANGFTKLQEIGAALKDRYDDFVATYTDRTVYVAASQVPRTMQSAEMIARTMFPTDPRVPTGSYVPVHMVEGDRDVSLRASDFCEPFVAHREDVYKSSEFLTRQEENHDILEKASEFTGTTIRLHNITTLWDVWRCQEAQNMTLMGDPSTEQERRINELGDYVMSVPYQTREAGRWAGGALLNDIVQYAEAHRADPENAPKFVMLVAHDTTIMALQAALEMYPTRSPSFADHMIFEIEGDFRGLKVRNQNGVLNVPGCGEGGECSWDEFKEVFGDQMVSRDDALVACGVRDEEPERSLRKRLFPLWVFLGTCGGFVVAGLLFLLFGRRGEAPSYDAMDPHEGHNHGHSHSHGHGHAHNPNAGMHAGPMMHQQPPQQW